MTDEERLVPAFGALKRAGRAVRLIIAPHEPDERHLAGLEARLERSGLAHARVAAVEAGQPPPEIVVVDRVGILADLYAVADLAYVGGGFMNMVHNRAELEWYGNAIPIGQGFYLSGTNDGPGYYGEVGAHLFFASKLSVLLSALHRSNEVRNLVNEQTGAPIRDAQGRPVSLDVGGTGFRMAVAIGL